MSLMRCGELKKGERQHNNGSHRDDHTDGSRGGGINRPFIVLHLRLLHSRGADVCALYARPSPVFLVTAARSLAITTAGSARNACASYCLGDALRRSWNGTGSSETYAANVRFMWKADAGR